MNSKVFSNGILSKMRRSAFEYAHTSYDAKQTSASLVHRVKILIGYKSDEWKIDAPHELEVIMFLLNSSLLEHRKKARDKSACYNITRHIQLNKLFHDLKEKRDKLTAYRV